jgi:zinc/manganese transport system substrate-binding protein
LFRKLCISRIYNAEKEVIIIMIRRTFIGAAIGLTAIFGLHAPAVAADKITVVASFSILGDMTRQVGGEHVDVVTLVGPDGDTHAFEPTPADVRTLADARLLIANGLEFESWLPRLVEASGFSGTQVTASEGIEPLTWEEAGDDDHHEDEHASGDHEVHEEQHAAHAESANREDGEHHHGRFDPHAWQSLANGATYVRNIADALIRLDPDHAQDYESRAATHIARLNELHERLKADFAAIPADRRKVVTSHDAFRYFGHAYGVSFIAPEGLSTESEASAGDVAKIIDQIREERLTAVFLENISDDRLTRQIVNETDARIGGQLYSDALSSKEGPAPDYVSMFEYNASQLLSALTGS